MTNNKKILQIMMIVASVCAVNSIICMEQDELNDSHRQPKTSSNFNYEDFKDYFSRSDAS